MTMLLTTNIMMRMIMTCFYYRETPVNAFVSFICYLEICVGSYKLKLQYARARI